MSTRYTVEVATKYGQSDARAQALRSRLSALGVDSPKDIRVSSLYEISGGMTKAQAAQAARDILADPITQEYRMGKSTPSQAFLLGPHWRIEVWLKPSVTDPTGESVRKAVSDIGLPAPDSVRTGTAYRLTGKMGRAQVEMIANKLLANPVIHMTTVSQQ